MSSNLFEAFNNGSLRLPTTTVKFSGIPWSKHPTFEGVELKHIVTAKDTNGEFSYHLVRIAPNKSIKNHLPYTYRRYASNGLQQGKARNKSANRKQRKRLRSGGSGYQRRRIFA